MKIEFTTEDAKELSHTICQSFYHGREGEFEMLHKNDDVPSNDQQLMYFYAFQFSFSCLLNIVPKIIDCLHKKWSGVMLLKI